MRNKITIFFTALKTQPTVLTIVYLCDLCSRDNVWVKTGAEARHWESWERASEQRVGSALRVKSTCITLDHLILCEVAVHPKTDRFISPAHKTALSYDCLQQWPGPARHLTTVFTVTRFEFLPNIFTVFSNTGSTLTSA